MIMSALFDFITSFVEITGNQRVDSIIIGVISIVSFLIAFGVVGKLFELVGLFSSSIMSDVHWAIRIFVFAVLTTICILIAKAISFVFGLPWWVLVIIALHIVILVVFVIVCVRKTKHSNLKQMAD